MKKLHYFIVLALMTMIVIGVNAQEEPDVPDPVIPLFEVEDLNQNPEQPGPTTAIPIPQLENPAATVYTLPRLPFDTSVNAVRVGRTGLLYQDDYQAAGLTGYSSTEYHPALGSLPASQRGSIDFQLGTGRVVAAKGGRVSQVPYGCSVYIDHGDGTTGVYIHLSNINVSVDQQVNAGDFLGNGANNCNASGAHLHFAVWQGGKELELRFEGVPSQSSNGHTCPANLICPSRTGYAEFRYSASNNTPVPTPTNNNLIANFSFELGGVKEYPNWSWINSCSRYTYTNGEAGTFTAYDGQRFLATAKSADYPNCQSVYQDVPRTLNIGDKYTLALHMRSGHGPQTVSTALWATGSTNHESSTLNANLTAQWQCFQTTLTISKTGNNRLRPEVYLQNMDKDVHLDNVRLIPGEHNLCGSGTPAGETGYFDGRTYTPWSIPLGDEMRVRFDIENHYPTAKVVDVTFVAQPRGGDFEAVNYVMPDAGTQFWDVRINANQTLVLEGMSRPDFKWNQQVYDTVCSEFDTRKSPLEVLVSLIFDGGFLLDVEQEAFDLAQLIEYPDEVKTRLNALDPLVKNTAVIISFANTAAQTIDILMQAEMAATSMDFTYGANLSYQVDGVNISSSIPSRTMTVYVRDDLINLYNGGIIKLIGAKSGLIELIGGKVPWFGVPIARLTAVAGIIHACTDIQYSTNFYVDNPVVHPYNVPATYTLQQLDAPKSWDGSISAAPLEPYLTAMLHNQIAIHENRIQRDQYIDNLIHQPDLASLSTRETLQLYNDTLSSSTNLIQNIEQAYGVLDMLENMMAMDESGYDYALLQSLIEQTRAQYAQMVDEQTEMLGYIGLMPIEFGLIGPGTIITNSYGNPVYLWPHLAGTEAYELYIAPKANLMQTVFSTTLAAADYCNATLCYVDVTDLNASGWLQNGEYSVYMRPTGGEWAQEYTFTLDVDPPGAFTNVMIDTTAEIPVISWDDHQDAAWYQIEVDSDVPYSEWHRRTPAMCDGLTCRVPVERYLVEGVYSARIRAWNPGGLSTGGDSEGWNGPFAFSMANTAPGLPTSMTAVPNADGRVTLSWTASPEADWYQLWLGVLEPVPATHINEWYAVSYLGCASGGTCSITPGTTLPAGNYLWYLQPWGPGGLIDNNVMGWVEGGQFTMP